MTIGELLAQFGNKYLVAMLTTWKLTAVSFAFALLIGVAVRVMRDEKRIERRERRREEKRVRSREEK